MKTEDIEAVIAAVMRTDVEEIAGFLSSGFDPNARDSDEAPLLYRAILRGNEQIVALLLAHGADPMAPVEEPARTTYSTTALELALQAEFLMNWDLYHPIVLLLLAQGARDHQGRKWSIEEVVAREQSAREWQSKKPG